jgi:hypothetical protein
MDRGHDARPPQPGRRRFVGLIAAVPGILAGVSSPGPAAAQGDDAAAAQETVAIDAFFGHWQGQGVAEGENDMFLSMSARDLDVTIRPHNDAFTVNWTTVIRAGSPDDPQIRRNSATLFFETTDRPNVWEAESSENPLDDGGTLSWARLEGATLTLYQLTLSDRGGYELTSYARTLEEDRMILVFTRLLDGAPVRSVRGRLSRTEG